METRRFLPYPFHKQRFYEGSFLRGLGSGSGLEMPKVQNVRWPIMVIPQVYFLTPRAHVNHIYVRT